MQDCLESDQVRNTQDIFEPHHEKTGSLHMQKKEDAGQLRGNHEADQRIVFAKWILESLCFLNPKFQAIFYRCTA